MLFYLNIHQITVEGRLLLKLTIYSLDSYDWVIDKLHYLFKIYNNVIKGVWRKKLSAAEIEVHGV